MKEKYTSWGNELLDNDDGYQVVYVGSIVGLMILTFETFLKQDPSKVLMSGTSYVIILIIYFLICELLLFGYNTISKNYYRDFIDAIVAKFFMLGFPLLLVLSPIWLIVYLNYKLFDKRRK